MENNLADVALGSKNCIIFSLPLLNLTPPFSELTPL